MTTILKITATTVAVGIAFAGLAGCPRQEGPAGRAGEKIQDAAHDAKK